MRDMLFIALIFSAGCSNFPNNDAPPTLKLEESTDYYSLAIYENATKVDEHGVIQCVNYSKRSVSDSSINLYGHSLSKTLAFLLGTEEKNLIMKYNPRELFLQIHYTWNEPGYESKDIILEKLREIYDFTISPEDRAVRAWEVEVINPGTLEESRANSAKKQAIKMRSNRLRTSGISVKDLANQLNGHFTEHIFASTSDETLYQFDIDISSFGPLKQQLEKDYGLLLQEVDTVVTVFRIEPEPNV